MFIYFLVIHNLCLNCFPQECVNLYTPGTQTRETETWARF